MVDATSAQYIYMACVEMCWQPLLRGGKRLDVEIAPTKKIRVLGLDRRSVKDLAWCAATYGVNRLYWVDGYLLCLEVYEKSIEPEIKNKEFPISHVCYAEFPKYERKFEVDMSLQVPIVNASDMKIFKKLLTAILHYEKEDQTVKKTRA